MSTNAQQQCKTNSTILTSSIEKQTNTTMIRAEKYNQASTARPQDEATLDQREVDSFGALAAQWWDPNGKFRPLHQLGPARLTFIRNEILSAFRRATDGMHPLDGLRLVDIGCGGGLMCEPLARLGANVTGLDPATDSIEAARRHAAKQDLSIDYQAKRAEDLVAQGKTFDIVLCLEVIEHVPDVAAFITAIAPLARPGGLIILSTINRTVKSYGLAILGAEYLLRWVPVGTHQWERFVTPDELAHYVTSAGLNPRTTKGLVYSPLGASWSLSTDTDVNYMMSATKPAAIT